jgi:hypothetical protein
MSVRAREGQTASPARAHSTARSGVDATAYSIAEALAIIALLDARGAGLSASCARWPPRIAA